MMVTFVSQCEKKALNRTRRVLDAFASRIGDNTWQTVITQEGLLAVKKLLRKTASKNTAISCHWLRSRSRSELVWVIGNRSKFNEQGLVPVNSTDRDMRNFMDKAQWRTLEVIKHAASVAGLFHDFGKANVLFQNKLKPKKKPRKKNDKSKSYEPYRHEWVSLRLFEHFVGKDSDIQWLERLGQVHEDQPDNCYKDGVDNNVGHQANPLASLAPFAQLVGWLILSHHRLPLKPCWKERISHEDLACIDYWFQQGLEAIWNSYNCHDSDVKERIERNWEFEANAVPYTSAQWRLNAIAVANKAKAALTHSSAQSFLHDDVFTSHVARLCLMLADHFWSSDDRLTVSKWRSSNYNAYANTHKKTKQRKQKLDEHLIGVAYHARNIAQSLPRLTNSLPHLVGSPSLESRSSKPPPDQEQFEWQNQAQKLAAQLRETSTSHGFFGINMASTGRGKTLANAKIMYALSDRNSGCRFSVALGLRTLTLQTGREYRRKLELTDDQLAIAVGGTAIRQLFAFNEGKADDTGSESQSDHTHRDLYVDFKNTEPNHSLSKWTKQNPKIEKLLQAPVLVCTIDHLILATEGVRGGKQIAPMLRLLTSDLVIDEPDDFGLSDLPALCRLVHWAGMLGSRVLLSTATMPPALASAAFQAYQVGWSHFAKSNLDDWDNTVNCAWFDEKRSESHPLQDASSYDRRHTAFVSSRIQHLTNHTLVKHRSEILPIELIEDESACQAMARVIQQGALQLHQHNNFAANGKKVSIGLVRMANIDAMVAVAKYFLALELEHPDTCISLCVYHSQFPLAIRSYLEGHLDRVLKRKPQETSWPPAEFTEKLNDPKQENQIFLVLASPVAEVGRDHDYDWAIVEPSSMRSIIQIAGRVLRHRNHSPTHTNILLLQKNIKALNNQSICFVKPGFEDPNLGLQMRCHDLYEVLENTQYRIVNAEQRVKAPEDYELRAADNLVALEHMALQKSLFTGKQPAKVWWENKPHWCGEVQNQQRFRKSRAEETLYLQDDDGAKKWMWKNENVYPTEYGEPSGANLLVSSFEAVAPAPQKTFWFDLDSTAIYQSLASELGISREEVAICVHCRTGSLETLQRA